MPMSMFHDSSAMRICKAKSDFKKRLAKEASSRCSTSNVAASVLDGSAVLSCGLSIGQLKVSSPTLWRISKVSC